MWASWISSKFICPANILKWPLCCWMQSLPQLVINICPELTAWTPLAEKKNGNAVSQSWAFSLKWTGTVIFSIPQKLSWAILLRFLSLLLWFLFLLYIHLLAYYSIYCSFNQAILHGSWITCIWILPTSNRLFLINLKTSVDSTTNQHHICIKRQEVQEADLRNHRKRLGRRCYYML